jgi:deoxyribonuclease V
MDVVRPEYVPDPSLSRAEMEALQRDIAGDAVFADETDLPPHGQALVAGVDQAFPSEDRAVSAVVVMRGDSVVEEVTAEAPVEIPYIPGLLSFREGGSILAALEQLDTDPDLLAVDGSGRIHFRQAGLATHIAVTVDTPALGVAKNLLCGTPVRPIPDDGLPAGETVPVEADGDVDAPEGTVIGHAVQTKQYDGRRHVNPLWVSPGHRVSAETAAARVLAHAAGYKLPEPTRRADQLAGEAARTAGT